MSYHLLPLNDERVHRRLTTCWCEPRVEWHNRETGALFPEALVIHNAADCREVVEWATRAGYGGWELWDSDESV